jgi:predicted kinase
MTTSHNVNSNALELVILMGLQASGKTTFRQMNFDRSHAIVSKDLLRNHRAPQRRQMQLIEIALAAGRSVVVDNTNPRLEDRQALIELARQFGARVRGFYFHSTITDTLARNSVRVGKSRVPDIGLFATAKVLRRPSIAEGFDELYFVRIAADREFIVEFYREDGGEA